MELAPSTDPLTSPAEQHTLHVGADAAVGGQGSHRHTLTFDSKMSRDLTRSHFPAVTLEPWLQHAVLPSYLVSAAAQAPRAGCDSLADADAAADGCPP